MNFGEGFSIPQDGEVTGYWKPVMPEKSISTRSHTIPVDLHGNQLQRLNWQTAGLSMFPIGNMQQMPNLHMLEVQNFHPTRQVDQSGGCYVFSEDIPERNRMINHISGSYAEGSSNQSTSWNHVTLADIVAMKNSNCMGYQNRTLCRNVNATEIPFHPNLHSQTESSWRMSNLVTPLLTKENQSFRSSLLRPSENLPQESQSYMNHTGRTVDRSINTENVPLVQDLNVELEGSWGESIAHTPFLFNKDLCSSSNLLGTTESLPQIPRYGLPEHYQANRVQHSLPRKVADTASSVTNSILQIAPITPDKGKKMENKQLSTILNGLEVSSTQKKDNQKNSATQIGNEIIQQNCDKSFQNLVVSSSAANTSTEVIVNPDKGSNQGIDLNKTPSEKPLKRRKFMPKVVKESTSKQAAKVTTPRNDIAKEKPSGKRKYVRKHGLKESATEQPEVMRESTDPNAGKPVKSCRRALNFDSNKSIDEIHIKIADQDEKHQRTKRPFDLNSVSQGTEFCSGDSFTGTKSGMQIGRSNILNSGSPHTDVGCGTKSFLRTEFAAHIGTLNEFDLVGQQQEIINNLTYFMNQTPTDNISQQEMQPGLGSLPGREVFQMEKLHAIPTTPDARYSGACQNSNTDKYAHQQKQFNAEGLNQIVFQAKTNSGTRERRLTSQGGQHLVSMTSHSPNEARYDQDYGHNLQQTYALTSNQTSSSLLSQNLGGISHRYGSSGATFSSENHKKMRTATGIYADTYNSPCVDDARQATPKGSDASVTGFTLQVNHVQADSYAEPINVPKRPGNGAKNSTGSCTLTAGSNLASWHISPALHSGREKMGESSQMKQVYHSTSQTARKNHILLPPTPPKTVCAPRNLPVQKPKSISPGKEDVLKKTKEASYDYQQPSLKKRGRQKKQIYTPSIDDIIYQLEYLNLNGKNHKLAQEQNAIVPYKIEGTIVPYESFNFIKKRKPRPKVDLDPETNRTWRFLMGIEEGEDLEGTDMDKEKWWEEERKVFRGRADSFIARMHLVQGDRRFSRWKGSVVDSVIGVFLTQNVSDHLSSSAFMSLAARFPLKPIRNRKCDQNGTNILVEEPDICVVNPEETIIWHEPISRQTPEYEHSSIAQLQPAEHQKAREASGLERITLLEAYSQNAEEEIISSQDSFDSSVIQGSGGIRSYSSSSSDAEVPASLSKFDNICDPSLTNLIQMDKSYKFQDLISLFDEIANRGHNQLEGIVEDQQNQSLNAVGNIESSSVFTHGIQSKCPQMRAPDIFNDYQLNVTPEFSIMENRDMFAHESRSSWDSNEPQLPPENNSNSRSKIIGPLTESVGKNEIQPLPQERLRTGSYTLSGTHSVHRKNNQQERNKTFQLESAPIMDPEEFPVPPAISLNGTVKHISSVPTCKSDSISTINKQEKRENKLVESNSTQKVSSSGKDYNGKAKRRSVSVGKNAVDWDSLRRQVQPNGWRKERNKDAMDSLDYEALRCANVNEISDAIKERGMNNMLAERIKEFLNRLVSDHGRTDLEWLRDIPPDKAKDYLLSVRGLGLKSVECVRLLTLHHLAFPVDTNVGRIAVRLGWVPLQPLPESLQLHLLEMYPVLESIQKYLWPRLCKLDQRTLYELHYQMITFGKVFCTKSKPNCNACPMRGECRHFASAFASARLTLPAPEDGSIVSSTAPIAVERNTYEVLNHVPLSLLENNSFIKEAPVIGKCEPIIEEPTSPEQEHTDITVSDIEDAFYEDPDEIPTINLNIEEFTMNLQNYMQENNLEIEEGDMSKALVALNPEVASIPTPKLKNVSRLRTEHQVYELPDSHLLLNGMDIREPDDPSPYLLAIWSPGETANSIQPPEGSCGSHESDRPCSEKTCISCNSRREASSQTVRGTILIPCRTAMRGSFPLNGTYFQVNEMFADHDSSITPIDVPRAWIWNLPRRTVFFGTSVSTIFKGLSTEDVQFCFWRGFVCVRGFDPKARAPRPLMARLHFPASKSAKTKK